MYRGKVQQRPNNALGLGVRARNTFKECEPYKKKEKNNQFQTQKSDFTVTERRVGFVYKSAVRRYCS